MKNTDLIEAIGLIDSKYVDEASVEEQCVKNVRTKRHRHGVKFKKWMLAPIAVSLAVVIVLTNVFFAGPNALLVTKVQALSLAEYPRMTKYPTMAESGDDYDSLHKQWESDIARQESYFGKENDVKPFIKNSVSVFLSNTNGKNTVYSPLNTYMSLAMIAEISEGNTRAQAMNALGCNSIEEVRTRANTLWNANYRDDGKVRSIIAGSVWLSDRSEYSVQAANILADKYYASVYTGKMGSDKYNEEYMAWIKTQTGNPMTEYMDGEPLHRDTVISMASTISYEASWEYLFADSRTKTGVFHTDNGNISCEYMNKIELYGSFYYGNNFTATSKELDESGSVYFILPNENVSVDELMNDDDLLDFIVSDGKWANKEDVVIEITVPKFDISSGLDLEDGFEKMGVTDCFNKNEADFSGIVKDDTGEDIYVTNAEHSVRVSINEDGCTGTAFTGVSVSGSVNSNKPEKNFRADRPFIFVITGADGLPLFVGVVHQPTVSK